MQNMSGVWGELSGWAAVLTGLAVFASLIVLMDRRRPSPKRADNAAAKDTTLGPRREWALVMDSAGEGLARSTGLAALQADTAMKIEAAEHAYNRLVADVARLCGGVPAAQTAEPAPQPVSEPQDAPREPEKVVEQTPLAA